MGTSTGGFPNETPGWRIEPGSAVLKQAAGNLGLHITREVPYSLVGRSNTEEALTYHRDSI